MLSCVEHEKSFITLGPDVRMNPLSMINIIQSASDVSTPISYKVPSYIKEYSLNTFPAFIYIFQLLLPQTTDISK